MPQELRDSLLRTPTRKEWLSSEPGPPLRSGHGYHYLVGGYPADARFQAFSNTACNVETALLERVFFHEVGGVFVRPPDPSTGVVRDLLCPFRSALLRHLSRTAPVERHQFVAATYRGRKLAVYTNALKKLDTRGLRHSDSYISTFVKVEKLPDGMKRVVPRVIQPRSPCYNIELGRYLHPVEHTIYKAIDRVFGAPTVMKGLNATQQGAIFYDAWTQFRDPIAVGIDASRFDQHIRRGLLEWEHSIYYHLFSNDPYLRMILRWQLETRGFARVDGRCFQYRVSGGRCSGDMNTALGNVLVACAAVYAFLKSNCALGVRVLDAGDDCMLIGERADINRITPLLPEFFSRLGLVMKVEPSVDILEQVSFCQTSPVYDGVAWRMVRDPRVTLTKDSSLVNHAHLQHLRDYLQQVGSCGLSLTGGLPVLQDYYRSMCGSRSGSVTIRDQHLLDSGFYRLSVGMREQYRPVSDVARVSFCRAFGIVPDLQVALERYYQGLVPPVTVTLDEVERVRLGNGVVWSN